jgi:uncharacterized membrane protein
VNRLLAVGLTAAAVVWAVLIVAAPVALHSRTALRPVSMLYASSSRICHQRPERSFSIAGFQMPVCARCSGLYVSAAAGTLLAWPRRRRTARMPRGLLFAAALPTAITFTLEVIGVMRFSNVLRTLAALPLGACAGWLFVQMLRYDSRLDGDKNADR